MKICSTCKVALPITDFNKNKSRSDGLQSMCKECWKIYYKEKYYKSPKEKARLATKRDIYRKSLRKISDDAKDIPCMDCGIKYPPFVMDFDHRDPQMKSFNISMSISQGISAKKLSEEIAKCDVVCANCHRLRTYS